MNKKAASQRAAFNRWEEEYIKEKSKLVFDVLKETQPSAQFYTTEVLQKEVLKRARKLIIAYHNSVASMDRREY